MKILHTADWHLGQTFFEYDRKWEHEQFLMWLQEQIKLLNADVLLIAGDIFDSPNPSAEAQRMFYTFLRQVTMENTGLQIVIIAGNHDSATRLEAPTPLLEGMKVFVRGVIKRDREGKIDEQNLIIPLYQGDRKVCNCLAVPYLRQGDYPAAESYALGVQKMYRQLYHRTVEEGLPVIAMGHLQATGSEISENDRSERTIIGGLECISPDAFDKNIKYAALGHLHRNQRVSGREEVRYAGSPIPMSFAERRNRHGVVFVDIEGSGPLITFLEFRAPVELLSIPTQAMPLEAVLKELEDLPCGEVSFQSPYLEIKVLMKEPEPAMRFQIENALQGKAVRLARIAAVFPEMNKETRSVLAYEELKALHPMEMAVDIFKKKYGGEDMPETMKQLLQSVIQEVRS